MLDHLGVCVCVCDLNAPSRACAVNDAVAFWTYMLVDPCRLALTLHNPKLLATNSAVIDASIRHLALDFFATAGMHTPACDAVLGVVHALATTRRRKAWCADGRWHTLFMEAEGSNNT